MTSSPMPGVASQNAAARPEGLTLVTLPDVPLLRVLSFVSLKDLSAAGRAHPRLAELTRTHRPLWRRPRAFFANSVEHKTIAELVEHLQFAPPFDKCVFDNSCGCCHRHEFFRPQYWKEPDDHYPRDFDADFDLDSCLDVKDVDGVTELTVNCRQRAGIICIDALAPMKFKSLKYLRYCVGMPDLSNALRNAHSLETLILEVRAFLGLWPQDLVLPSLRSVELYSYPDWLHWDIKDCDPTPDLTGSTFKAISSLLRAHSGQLREVSLHEDELNPLLFKDTWPKDLDRLTLEAPPAVVEKFLQNVMQGLKELCVRLDYEYASYSPDINTPAAVRNASLSYSQQVQQRLGLQRLELMNCRPATVAALLAGGLHGLEALCVELEEYSPPLSPETFRDISAAAIPALNLLVVRSLGYRREGATGVELDPVLKDLVRRAPVQTLHVAVERPSVPKAKNVCLMLFRHSPEEPDCSLCANAAAFALSLHHLGSDRIERVQVL